MRAVGLVVAIIVIAWSVPVVETAALRTPETITVVREIRSGPTDFMRAGADTLMFPVPPRARTGPVLPDIPIPLPAVAPDAPPSRGWAHALETIEFLIARLPAAPVAQERRRVTANILNLRDGPARSFPVVASLEAGDIAVVEGETRSGWVPVRMAESGRRGWVFHRYLAAVPRQTDS